MSEEKTIEEENVTEEEKIDREKAEAYNRKVCELVSVFFNNLASITPDEIYDIASQSNNEDNSVLLNAINKTFQEFLEKGEGVHRLYFDSYERTVDQFVHVFKLNIRNKLEHNKERLIAQAVGKDMDDVTYTDIARAIKVEQEEK